jgi:hypothetical protein
MLDMLPVVTHIFQAHLFKFYIVDVHFGDRAKPKHKTLKPWPPIQNV